MLVNFRFKNCRSFYEEANLSLEATKDKQYGELNVFSGGKSMYPPNAHLLKSVLLFGGNASGKSNVLKAISFMKECVLSSAVPNISAVRRNETFAFLLEASREESLYEVDFIENGRFYRYGFTIKEREIVEEWLRTRGDKGRLTRVYERKGEKVSTPYGDDLGKLVSLSEKTLFLSFSPNLRLPEMDTYLKDAFSWFSKLIVVFDDLAEGLEIYEKEGDECRKKALEILALSEIGIKDMKLIKSKIGDDALSGAFPSSKRGQIARIGQEIYDIDLETVFDILDEKGEKAGEKRVRLFKDEGFLSEGTEHLVSFLGLLLFALEKGRVIFLDEIDAKLQYFVAQYLIELFNSLDHNPHNAQLVTTAHNVMLMDKNVRRDQIYFISKDESGRSSLTSLSDYRDVRKDSSYGKRYLAGFYADLPNMHHL